MERAHYDEDGGKRREKMRKKKRLKTIVEKIEADYALRT